MDKEKAKALNESAKKLIQDEDFTCFQKDSWAKIYVEAEKSIPIKFRNDFIDELTSSNEEYRKALEESVRYFGVRWTKE